VRAAAAGCACDSVSCVEEEEENLVEEELTLVTAEGITAIAVCRRSARQWRADKHRPVSGNKINFQNTHGIWVDHAWGEQGT